MHNFLNLLQRAIVHHLVAVIHKCCFFGVHCPQRKLRCIAKVPPAGWSTMNVWGQSSFCAATAVLEEFIYGLLVGFLVSVFNSWHVSTLCIDVCFLIRKLDRANLHDLLLYLASCFVPFGHSWQDLNLLGQLDLFWWLELFDFILFVFFTLVWNANWTKVAHWLLSTSFFVCCRLENRNNFISFNNFTPLVGFWKLRGRLQRVLFQHRLLLLRLLHAWLALALPPLRLGCALVKMSWVHYPFLRCLGNRGPISELSVWLGVPSFKELIQMTMGVDRPIHLSAISFGSIFKRPEGIQTIIRACSPSAIHIGWILGAVFVALVSWLSRFKYQRTLHFNVLIVLGLCHSLANHGCHRIFWILD